MSTRFSHTHCGSCCVALSKSNKRECCLCKSLDPLGGKVCSKCWYDSKPCNLHDAARSPARKKQRMSKVDGLEVFNSIGNDPSGASGPGGASHSSTAAADHAPAALQRSRDGRLRAKYSADWKSPPVCSAIRDAPSGGASHSSTAAADHAPAALQRSRDGRRRAMYCKA